MENEGKKYLAFISYKHDDKPYAKWLQEKIESFRLPTYIQDERPDLPEYPRPIFRDETDLELGYLSNSIHKALSQSKYLIVICSPQATTSKYVEDEISYFVSNSDRNNIIPFIIAGMPNSNDSQTECFPKPLKSIEGVLAANINEMGQDYAMIKVIARMLDLSIDSLWQRYRIAEDCEKQRLLEERNKLLRVQSYYLAEKANGLVYDCDSLTARALLLRALPSDYLRPNRPYVLEAESALLSALQQNDVTLKGHSDYITTLFFDGKYLYSGSYDCQIRIWDIRTGSCIKRLDNDTPILCMFVWGNKLYCNATQSQIRVWDLHKENCSICIQAWPKNYYSYTTELGISYIYMDDRIFAFGSYGDICVYDKHSKVTKILKGSFIYKDTLVSVGRSSCKLVNLRTGKVVEYNDKIVNPFNKFLNIKSSYIDDDYLYIGDSCVCHVIDIFKEEVVATLSNDNDKLYPSAITANDSYIAVGYNNGDIVVWNKKELKIITQFNKHKARIKTLLFVNETTLASGDGTIHIWEIKPQNQSSVIETSNTVVTIAFDNDKIYAGINDHKLIVFDHGNEQHILNTLIAGPGDPNTIIEQGDKLIVSSFNCFRVWDKHNYTYQVYLMKQYGDVFISLHNNILAAGGNGNYIHLYNIENGKSSKIEIDAIEESMTAIVHNGSLIVTAHRDNIIRIWDENTGQLLNSYSGHTYDINALIIYEDKYIISGSNDNDIRIWDIEQNSCKHILSGHTSWVTSLLSYQNRLISGSRDGYVRIWDIESGQCIHTQFVGGVYSMAYDGLTLIVGRESSILSIHLPLAQNLLDECKESISSRKLTEEELNRYHL